MGARTIAVGTDKGMYVLREDAGAWDVDGPLHPGWRVTAIGDAPDGRVLTALASNWFGVSVHASDDLRTFTQVGAPAWAPPDATAGAQGAGDAPATGRDAAPGEGDDRALSQVWTFHTVADTVYAGVADAGLFRSDDLATWEPVTALNEHASRPTWMPWLGGLCAHHVVDDGADGLWVAISSVGVWHSPDGGATVERRDDGVPPAIAASDGAPADAWCVHGLVNDPARPERLWRQEHRGVFRSSDGGRSWERCEQGLPGEVRFGMPIVRDHASGRLFVVPLESDGNRVPVDGRFAAWSSDDDGDSWSVAGTGWPDEPTFTGVLRNAMHADQAGTVALGTTAGQLWGSTDGGDAWRRLPGTYPRINAVRVWTDRR